MLFLPGSFVLAFLESEPVSTPASICCWSLAFGCCPFPTVRWCTPFALVSPSRETLYPPFWCLAWLLANGRVEPELLSYQLIWVRINLTLKEYNLSLHKWHFSWLRSDPSSVQLCILSLKAGQAADFFFPITPAEFQRLGIHILPRVATHLHSFHPNVRGTSTPRYSIFTS